MLSDNGREFRNGLIPFARDLIKVRPRFASAYNPKGNGLTENANAAISGVIARLLAKDLVDTEQ